MLRGRTLASGMRPAEGTPAGRRQRGRGSTLTWLVIALASAISAVVPAAAQAAGPDPVGTIYVADFGANAIDVFAPGANGNVAPVRTIAGPTTELGGPADVAVDSAGHVYSSNFSTGTITEYAPGASGDAAPINTISGAATGLSQNDDMSLAADGTLFVGNFNSPSPVVVFGPGATGNVAPLRQLSGSNTGLSTVDGLGADATGTLYVDNTGISGINVFAPGANGNVAPIRTIAGPATNLASPDDIKVGFGGQLVVTNQGNSSILVFASGVSGNVAPTRDISGSNTGLTVLDDLALDANGGIYVTNFNASGVDIFAPGADGNVAPTRTLAGPATTFSEPEGIAVATPSSALTLSTTTSPSVSLGGSTQDTATLSGGSSPTGSIIFKLFGPGDATCSSAPAFTSPLINVAGNGTYPSPAFTPTATGTYFWVAEYSGDAGNPPAAEACGAASETVTVGGADQPITATGTSFAAVEGTSQSAAVATFTDPDAGATAGEYSATIDWGDASTSTGTITGTGGVFTVTGSHAYAEEGSDTITVTVNDVDNTNSATASTSVSVSDAALSAAGATVNPVEGVAGTQTVATFTDADPAGAGSDYQATINWGDGTTTTGMIAPGAAGFQVLGAHAYAEEGSDAIKVTISDAGGTSTNASSTAKVADARLSARGVPTLTHATISGTVASFTDKDPHGTLSDYGASINWGDGTTTTGKVTAGSGKFNVGASHRYKTTGSFQLKVVIKDKGGQTATARSTVKLSRPARAKLSGVPAACTLRAFTVTLSGAQISTVTFLLDGTRVSARTVHRGARYTGLIALRPGSHRLTAKVTFRRSSHARPRTLQRSVSGCPVIAPKFTG
jgi:hypothetical protein